MVRVWLRRETVQRLRLISLCEMLHLTGQPFWQRLSETVVEECVKVAQFLENGEVEQPFTL